MVTAVFFGDSITAGAGASDPTRRWADLVAAALDWADAVNAGHSATILQHTPQRAVATVGAAADQNGRDTYLDRVAAHRPAWVLILYGLNDMRLNDPAITVERFQADLGEVVDGLVASGVAARRIVIGSPPHLPAGAYALHPPWDGGGPALHARYDAACAAVAASRGARFADVYRAMADGGGDRLVSPDQIHPNDAGHAVIAAAFLAAIRAS